MELDLEFVNIKTEVIDEAAQWNNELQFDVNLAMIKNEELVRECCTPEIEIKDEEERGESNNDHSKFSKSQSVYCESIDCNEDETKPVGAYGLDENSQIVEKSYICHMCAYKCAHKSGLDRHIRVHTGEKPFACDKCQYKCTQKTSLTEHIRTHTGEKPFECHLCEFTSATKSHLVEHIRIHTGEKRYECHLCVYSTVRKSQLDRHVLIHTGEKPFACNKCQYKCARRYRLAAHIRSHK